MNQLNIFDTPAPASAPQTPQPGTVSTVVPEHSRFRPGVRVRIIQSGPPLEHLKGSIGEIVSLMPGFASVKIDSIAVAMLFRVEALEEYSEISQYVTTHEEATDQITVGSVVECDRAFIGKSGVIRRVEHHGKTAIAWVDFGHGKPLYPAVIESLSAI